MISSIFILVLINISSNAKIKEFHEKTLYTYTIYLVNSDSHNKQNPPKINLAYQIFRFNVSNKIKITDSDNYFYIEAPKKNFFSKDYLATNIEIRYTDMKSKNVFKLKTYRKLYPNEPIILESIQSTHLCMIVKENKL